MNSFYTQGYGGARAKQSITLFWNVITDKFAGLFTAPVPVVQTTWHFWLQKYVENSALYKEYAYSPLYEHFNSGSETGSISSTESANGTDGQGPDKEKTFSECSEEDMEEKLTFLEAVQKIPYISTNSNRSRSLQV